jgi:TPR repeat protein
MNRKLVTLMLLSFFFVSSAALGQDTILVNVDYSLKEREISSLSLLALQGDGKAAERLVNYHLNRNTRKDFKRARYWAQIGAENGEPEAQFMYFNFLLDSKRIDEQYRALFWLRESARKGHKHAKMVLEECNSIDSRYSHAERTPCFGPGAESPFRL